MWLIDGKLVLATHETEVIGTPEDGREANVKALRFAGPLMRAIRIKVKAKATPQPTATSPPPKPTKTAVPPTPTDQPPSPTTVSKPTDVVKPTATAVVGKATRTPRRAPRPTAIPKQKGQSPLAPPPAPKDSVPLLLCPIAVPLPSGGFDARAAKMNKLQFCHRQYAVFCLGSLSS